MIADKDADDLKDEKLKDLILYIIVFSAIVLGLYVYFFYSADVSEKSSDWGALGDYFNGMLSPIIGFITIILIYRTYELQKKELKETRAALTDQVIQAKSSAKREMLWKSAEEVYKEIFSQFTKTNGSYTDEFLIGRLAFSGTMAEMRDAEAKLVRVYMPLIDELNDYLVAIDGLVESDSRSTNFFRRRIVKYFKPFSEVLEIQSLCDLIDLYESKIDYKSKG